MPEQINSEDLHGPPTCGGGGEVPSCQGSKTGDTSANGEIIMKLNIDAPKLRPWLRAVEPSLPLLATRAAVELDAQRQGSAAAMGAVRKLSDLLRNSFDQEIEGGPQMHQTWLLDPNTEVLVARALASIPEKRVTKVAELREMMRQIADWLDQSADQIDASRAEVLRDFCLALARGASAHHREFRDERPTSQYRR